MRRRLFLSAAFLIAALATSELGQAQSAKIPSGYPTEAPAMCQSGYSSHNLLGPGPYDVHLCMDKAALHRNL